jgi:outer membrane protein insertion porin family
MRATDRYLSPVLCACAAGLLGCTMLWCTRAWAQQPQPTARPGAVMISDVIVQGNKLISTQTITGQLKTRAGTEYQPDVVQEDIRTLMATKQFINVQPVIVPDQDAPGRVRVYFTVRELPTTVQKVIFQGRHHIDDDELEKVTGIHKGMPLNPVANKLACQAIVRRLNEDGRLFCDCTLVSGDKPGDTEVIFAITEGYKLTVSDIEFVGNTFVSAARLATQITTGKAFLGLLGGRYNPNIAEDDVQKLLTYYHNFGFYDVKVSHAVKYGADGEKVVLVFYINEGPQYRLNGAPVLDGKNLKPEIIAELSPLIHTGDGAIANNKDVTGDVDRIKNWVGYQGYDPKVTAIPVFSQDTPGLVRMQYEVEEVGPFRVGRILIEGNSRTKQNVILRQLDLYPGQVLPYPEIVAAQQRLARLNIFKNTADEKPTITIINPDPNSEFKDLLVTVTEDNTGSLLFGVGVNSDAGLTGSIVLNERNFDITRVPTSFEDLISGGAFRGAGQEFRVEAVPGTEVQRYTVSWRDPAIFDSKWSLTVAGYYYQRQYNEYDENRLGTKVTLARKLNKYWSITGSIRAEDIEVDNVPLGAPPEITNNAGTSYLVGFKAGVIRDTRDNFMRPTEGNVFNASVEQCTGTYNFTLANSEFNQYFTTWQRADGSGRQVLALHSQVSWASDTTPVFERYYAGGFASMRGFEFRGVGPEVDGFKVGGDFMFINSLEYQVPVLANDQFYVVGFVDSGTVEQQVEIRDYRVAAGFGVRFVVPMLGPVPIALDFGFPIVKASTDNTQVFSFWLGFTH